MDNAVLGPKFSGFSYREVPAVVVPRLRSKILVIIWFVVFRQNPDSQPHRQGRVVTAVQLWF